MGYQQGDKKDLKAKLKNHRGWEGVYLVVEDIIQSLHANIISVYFAMNNINSLVFKHSQVFKQKTKQQPQRQEHLVIFEQEVF